MATQRLPASLTPFEIALAELLRGLEPVAPIELRLSEALRCVAAEMAPAQAFPARDVAARDGWAMRANDLVGASSYSPLPLARSPIWVEAGDAMPDGSDCVLDSDLVDATGPLAQVLAEAIPGQGVRRRGHDIADGGAVARPGRPVSVRDLLIARAAGLEKLKLRRPRLRLVNIPGGELTAHLIAETARAAGAEVTTIEAEVCGAASVASAFDDSRDLLVTIGGSGVGRTDAAVMALAARGEVIAHGIALEPGRTSAVGRVGAMPAVALPGAPDQAFAAWWALARPVLDHLSGWSPRKTLSLPLARKIASTVGIAEVVLLEYTEGAWKPLAVGDLSLGAIARADAWLLVPGSSEGFAAGTPLDAYMLRE